MKIDNILNIIIIILFIIILIAIFFYPWQETPTATPIIAPIPTPRSRQRPSQTLIPGETEIETQILTHEETAKTVETQSICIERTPGEWEYINETCDPLNNTTLITNRSRQITIQKTNGENECSFEPLANETIFESDIDKGYINSNQKIQFRPNVLRLNTVQTEKNKEPNHIKCKCDISDVFDVSDISDLSENIYTEWSNWNKTCPDPSDNTLLEVESDLLIFRNRTRRYKLNSDKLKGSACIFTEEVGLKCPRNCKGPDASLNTSYSDWDNTNWEQICPDPTDTIRPASDYTIIKTRTRTYNYEIKELNGGECPEADVKYTKEEVKIDCSRNCFGGKWGYTGCNAPVCQSGDIETEPIKKGKKKKRWEGGTEAINGGKTCAEMYPTDDNIDCQNDCNINCKGNWSACNVACGNGKFIFITNPPKANGGEDCKDGNDIRKNGDTKDCFVPCAQNDCKDNYSPCNNELGIDYQTNTPIPAGPGGNSSTCQASGFKRQCPVQTTTNNNLMFIRYPEDRSGGEFTWPDTQGWKSMQTQHWRGEAAENWGLEMNDDVLGWDRFRYRWDDNGYIRPGSNAGEGRQTLCLGSDNNNAVWKKHPNCLPFGYYNRQIRVKKLGSPIYDYCLEPETDYNDSKMIYRVCSGKTIQF